MARRIFSSSAESGSSSRSMRGEGASARASATLCCSPPLRLDTLLSARPARPTRSIISVTRRLMSARGTPRTLRPYPIFSETFMWGNTAYCWNIMPRLRRQGGILATSFPSMAIRPESGATRPAIMRRIVDFPDPLGPRKVKNSPRLTINDSRSAVTVRPNRFVRRSSSRMASAIWRNPPMDRFVLRLRSRAPARGRWSPVPLTRCRRAGGAPELPDP